MNLNPVTCKSFLFLIQMDVPLQQIVYRRVTVENYLSAVMTFRPEFLNRVDDIVVFKALAKEQVKKIAALLLETLNQRLQHQVKISLEWSDEVLNLLSEQGFDPNFGARPLRRLLYHTVETALSKEIIKGEIKEGDVVSIGLADGQLTFKAK